MFNTRVARPPQHSAAMDLSTKDKNDSNQEKKFYCPTEGCVFSKGYGKSFKKKMLVDQHFLNCHSERKFKCPNCGKSYAIEWQLTYHTKTCGIDWACLSCNKCYKERLSLITHCKRHNHVLPENAKMKKQKKTSNSSDNSNPLNNQNNQNNQSLPSTTNSMNNNHHALSINNLASLNLNHLNHVSQLSLQPRTDSIIDHSVDQNYLNSNFLLSISNRSLLNLNSLNSLNAANGLNSANNFNYSIQ